MYHIGIDPGIRTGFAVWDSRIGKFLEVRSLKLYLVFEKLHEWNSGRVWIENPNTWVPFGGGKEADVRRQGAGAVKQTYKHIIEWLDDKSIPYQSVRLQGGLKKTTAEFFRQQTGWEHATNEHGRDAAFLVWKRTEYQQNVKK